MRKWLATQSVTQSSIMYVVIWKFAPSLGGLCPHQTGFNSETIPMRTAITVDQQSQCIMGSVMAHRWSAGSGHLPVLLLGFNLGFLGHS